jgi:hypothetical protein
MSFGLRKKYTNTVPTTINKGLSIGTKIGIDSIIIISIIFILIILINSDKLLEYLM